MASPKVVTAAVVKRFMRDALAKEAGWADAAAVTDESELYDPPARTGDGEVPAHFGFPDDRETVPAIVIGVGERLLGSAMLARRRPLNRNDLAITRFGPGAATAYLRLNSLVRRVVFEAVAEALGKTTGHKPGEFQSNDPPPHWEGNAAFDTFIGFLTEQLRDKVTHLPDRVIDPKVEAEIRGADTNIDIRNVLLKDVVKDAVKRRVAALEAQKDDS